MRSKVKGRKRIEKEWTVTDATGIDGGLVFVVARNGVEDVVFHSRDFDRSVAVSYRLGRIEETLKAEHS
jgi:hypothetical protein